MEYKRNYNVKYLNFAFSINVKLWIRHQTFYLSFRFLRIVWFKITWWEILYLINWINCYSSPLSFILNLEMNKGINALKICLAPETFFSFQCLQATSSTAVGMLSLAQQTGLVFQVFFLWKHCECHWTLGTLRVCSLAHRVSVLGADSQWCGQKDLEAGGSMDSYVELTAAHGAKMELTCSTAEQITEYPALEGIHRDHWVHLKMLLCRSAAFTLHLCFSPEEAVNSQQPTIL